ncbi:MAG: hypothetical protein ACOYXO_09825 [Chloroflexota bacterium]
MIDPQALKEILQALTFEQWLKVAKAVAQVRAQKHGEVILVIKNGALYFVDRRLSEDVRRMKGETDG